MTPANNARIETRATGSYDLRDGMTGVRGRYTLYNEVEQLMGRDLYVVLADVDNFRLINDAYGENVGNELLRRIGQTIQAKFGDEHTFRYGSDEFVVVCFPARMFRGSLVLSPWRTALPTLVV